MVTVLRHENGRFVEILKSKDKVIFGVEPIKKYGFR